MKYNLHILRNFYEVKEEIEKLEQLGFTFAKAGDTDFLIEGEPEIEISSLIELEEFIKEWKEITIDKDNITINNL